MTKILRIINRFNIGGPTYNATFLTKFMDEEFETLLIGGLPEEDESDSLHIVDEYGVKPLLIPEMKRTPNFRSDRAAYLKIKSIIEEYKPDIVHTHASKAGALGRRAAKKCGVPIIVHTFHGHVFHSYFGKLKTLAIKKIEQRLSKLTTGIIAISERQKEELTEIHNIAPAEKVEVIPLGFDLQKFYIDKQIHRSNFRKEFDIEENTIVIAIIGRLAAVKNHQLFLEAMLEVFEKTKENIKVFIVGDGSEKEKLEDLIESKLSKFKSQITFTGWIQEISSFNHAIDIICLSSVNEGTPVSLIEAQAAGIPIITTNVGGVRDVVENGKTGIIVDSFNPLDFAAAILELTENQKKRSFMSQNGRKFVEDKFTYQRLVEDMKIYYRKLLIKNG